MAQFKNPMEIFKLLDKSNCRKCYKPTCLAFAAAVFQGEKQLDECPHLEPAILEKYGGPAANHMTLVQEREQAMEQLKGKIATLDLRSTAQRLGARFSDDKLTIRKNCHPGSSFNRPKIGGPVF